MEHNYILPQHVELRKRSDCCLIIDRNYDTFLTLHPSEAFVLSLLNGHISMNELNYLVRETYSTSDAKASLLIDKVLNKTKSYLVKAAKNNPGYRKYNPEIFLFNGPAADEPLKSPLSLNIFLSKYCNFRCRYCYFGTDFASERGIQKDTVLNLIEQAANMGVVDIILSGGEPLLYKDICEVISAITQHGMIPEFSTNGSMLDNKMVANLKEAGLKSIQVSLDAPTPELHHFLTRTNNTFETILSGISLLVKNDIRVIVRSVITPYNYSHVGDLIELLIGLGVKNISFTSESTGAHDCPTANSLPKLNKEQTNYLHNIIKEKSNKYTHAKIICNSADTTWQQENEIVRCGALFSSMVIHSSGEATVCEMIENISDFSYGNVYESSLQEIWLGPAHQQLLKKTIDPLIIDQECSQCKHLIKCHTGCFNNAKRLKNNFYSKDPRCCIVS